MSILKLFNYNTPMTFRQSSITKSAFRIVFTYTVVSIIYIYFSDYLLEQAVNDLILLSKIQTYKGIGFVGISAILLFLLIRQHLRALARYNNTLLDQEKVYRAMLENNNDVIIRVDFSGKVVFCSNNLIEATGYTATFLNNSPPDKFVFAEDLELITRCWDNIIAHPRKLSIVEFRIIDPNGNLQWMECSMANHLADYQINGIIINARNIDQRKKSEDRLRKSEDKYTKLFNSNPLTVWIYDVATLKFVDVNEAAVIHYGYTRNEFLNMSLPDIRPKEELPRLMDAVSRAKTLQHNDNKELFKHVKKNGEQIIVRIESISIHLEKKSYRMALAIDMTEFLSQQDKLKDTNYKLKLAQEIANLGYWSQDLQTNNIYWSDEMYKIFDRDPATFTPNFEAIFSAVHQDDKYLYSNEFEQKYLLPGGYEIEHRIITPSGLEKWHLCRVKLTVDNGKILQREGIVVDITKRKNDEQAIIRKSNLLNALNRFTASLLSNESWVTVFDKSMEIVAKTLNLDKIFYFEAERDEITGEPFGSLKQQWAINTTERAKQYPAFNRIDFNENKEAINKLYHGIPLENPISAVPPGGIKQALEYAGVKTVYMQPIFLDNQMHGAFGFFDCQNERVWEDDEKLFVESLVSNIAAKIEKYRAELEVRVTKEQFESVITNLPGIAIRRRASGDWPVVFVNDEIERLTGYPASDFINNSVRTFESLIHPSDRNNKVNTVRTMLPDTSFSLEFRIIRRDGNIIWMKGNGRSIAGNDGKVAFIDEVLLDATETYEKKQQLTVSNERFRTVMKAAAEAIIDWDIINDSVVWGDGFREFFGYDLSKYDNALWSRNIHPDDQGWVLELMDKTIADPTKEMFYAEFRFLKANGQVAYVQNRCTFIRDEHGKAIRGIGAIADVTEPVERRLKIEKQNESLREIAWIQSHVIRAPLATLLGLMTLFKEREQMELDEIDLVEKIMQSANSLDKVIHEVVRKSESVSNL